MALAGGMVLRDRMRPRGNPFGQPEDNSPITPGQAYASSIGGQLGDYQDIMGRYKNALGQGPGQDYTDIMGKYKDVLGKMGSGPNDLQYNRSKEWGESYGLLKDLAQTGGLSEADQGNLRARGISPIRSVYANMQRNMDRRAALSGGRSANYNASAAKMARESSEQIANQVTNVNAEIAKMVQEGKLKSAPALANMAAGENEFSNSFRLQNEGQKNDWFKNYAGVLGDMSSYAKSGQDNTADLLRGMTDLYGTNPGLVETFGNQVNTQGQIKNQAANNVRNYRNNTLQSLMRGMR